MCIAGAATATGLPCPSAAMHAGRHEQGTTLVECMVWLYHCSCLLHLHSMASCIQTPCKRFHTCSQVPWNAMERACQISTPFESREFTNIMAKGGHHRSLAILALHQGCQLKSLYQVRHAVICSSECHHTTSAPARTARHSVHPLCRR